MSPRSRIAWAVIGYFAILLAFVALGACAPKQLHVPDQAPPAVEVLVPLPVPCAVAQVPKSALPTEAEAVPDDIYRAVQLVLGDRAVLKADREKLAAANKDPCP